MNPAHLHIILNHIPVIGVPIGAALLVYGFLRKSEEVKRASMLAFIMIALITVPTFLAGKAAEDVVEHLPGVSENIIETHEEAATIGLIVTSVLGVVSLAGLALSVFRGALGFLPTIVLIVISFAVSGWLGRVANLGGKIRHTELRAGAALGDDDEADGDGDGGGQRRGRNRRGRGR